MAQTLTNVEWRVPVKVVRTGLCAVTVRNYSGFDDVGILTVTAHGTVRTTYPCGNPLALAAMASCIHGCPMESNTQARLRAAIRDVPDFPQPGVMFKDITPVLADSALLHDAIEAMADLAGTQQVDKVVGIDARGFIFGALLAARLRCGFIPARKKGKLPWRTHTVDYSLEYGTASLEIHVDAIAPGEKVLLADDLLATGGTAGAALKLMEELQAEVLGSVFFIELGFLHGRERVEPFGPVRSVVTY